MSKNLLEQFRLKETAIFEVKDAKGNPIEIGGKPVVFEMYSPASSKFVFAKYKFDNAANARNIALYQGKATKDNAEQQAKDEAEFLAAVTKDTGDIGIGALELYQDAGFVFIRSDVLKFVSAYENFTQS
jgi:hypothetical protein